MNKKNFCVIMAGGIGSRFWPLSRTQKPKQFLDILGTGKSLIQQTFDRFAQVIPKENILIVSNEEYGDIILKQLPEITKEQVLLEPMRRNTAPCIAYANYKIREIEPDANIVVAPSDHLILKEQVFLDVVKKGLDFVAENDSLLTLGIQPSRPETGYGYIQINGHQDGKIVVNESLRKVKTFTEKPDLKMAKVFLESGDFFWNSGIFFWSLKSITAAFESHLNEVDTLFREGTGIYNTDNEHDFIAATYPKCKNISIDYGIMEKADNVFVLCADFGWSDLGTWGSLYDMSEKDTYSNAVQGKNVFSYDNKNCLINLPNDKLAVIQGLEDFIIVDSDNILLICRMEDEQKIKHFVNDVRLEKGEDFI
ncbi:MAG: mannose-1-phosphate guanylyltransferase [Bacteroidales bacterium]|nr:mannose-1-phosphate guanylyltransferase [Bacteroidales bacterium]